MGQPADLADIRIRQIGPGTPQVGSQVRRWV